MFKRYDFRRGRLEVAEFQNESLEPEMPCLDSHETVMDGVECEDNLELPSPIINEDSYESMERLTSPQINFGQQFKASQPHHTKKGPFVHTFHTLPYLAKLEGIYKKNQLDVSYDTYYGRRPLFD